MKDTFWNHNFDKIMLIFLVLVLWFTCIWAAIHIFHHDIDNMGAVAFITFLTGSVSTVLGGLMLALRGQPTTINGSANNEPANPTDPTKTAK